MGRPRKSIEELKLSGTYQLNKKRYAKRVADETLHTVQTARFRAPKHFTPEERAAHREILATCPGVTEADRLLVEVCAQLLVKQRAGQAKTSEVNRLMATLERLRSRPAPKTTLIATVNAAPIEEDELDRYFREEAENEEDERLDNEDIRAEIERRRSIPVPDGLTEQQRKHYFDCYQVGLDIGVTVELYDAEERFAGVSSYRYQERLKERSR